MGRVNWSGVVGVAAGAMFILWILCYCVVSFNVQKTCLEAGWRDYEVTWDYSAFCVREENEYEIVIPLSQVK